MSIAISRMASGAFSVNPALTCYRIVPLSSPAFKLMVTYQECPELIPGELIKLFQDGKASPYDRLGNGFTLLHVRFPTLGLITKGIPCSCYICAG
jgi:hypothetical protein